MIADRRLDEAVRLLRERGLGGLVIYSDGTCNILKASYLRYFADFAPMGSHNAAVVTPEGRVVLVVEPAWDVARICRHSWIADVRGTDDFDRAIAGLLADLHVSGRVGLAGGGELTEPEYASLAAAVTIEQADDLIEILAREKSPADLLRVHRAAAAADAGFEAFSRAARVGVREYEIVAEVEYAMRLAGADDNFILLSSGRRNTAMRAPTDRAIEAGDIVIGEITPVVDGQFIQLCRTVSVGAPSSDLVQAYDLLMRAFESAIGHVVAGAPASTIASSIDAVLAEAGYAEYCRPPYMRTRGHGFGIGSVAPGALIDAETTEPLRSQQVVVVHPNQFLPTTGYLACGETFLVTSSGAERLARTETKLWVNEA